MAYDSSIVSSLKTVKEQIQGNYTSSQLLQVLDRLLEQAIVPIIENTTFMDRIVSVIIGWYTDNPCRKISSIGREKTFSLLFLYLAAKTVRAKKRILRQLRLERNILISTITLFLEHVRPYRDLMIRKIKTKDPFRRASLQQNLDDIEKQVGAVSEVYPMCETVTYWLAEAMRFKNMILEKYMRHIVNRAHAFQSQSGSRVDIEDLIQNFVLAASKAIDKADAGQGTLTTYINHWLKNASHNSINGHEYGVAYVIPQSVKSKIARGESHDFNLALALDDKSLAPQLMVDPEIGMEQRMEQDLIRRLAKAADPEGFARIALSIPEVL